MKIELRKDRDWHSEQAKFYRASPDISVPSAVVNDAAILDVDPGEPTSVRAVFVGERIKASPDLERVASSPAVYPLGENQIAVIFRYGVVVFFNTTESFDQEFLATSSIEVIGRFPQPEDEQTTLVIRPAADEGFVGDSICIHKPTIAHLQAIADILAKSVVLAHYDQELAGAFEAIEPMATELSSWRVRMRTSKLLGHIGRTLSIQHRMVGRVEVPEKPELVWERPKLDHLYMLLAHEFELRERHLAIERKLAVISNTAQTLLELVQAGRSLRVEWYIVILIVVEIILSLVTLS